jgi:hypothetical protein
MKEVHAAPRSPMIRISLHVHPVLSTLFPSAEQNGRKKADGPRRNGTPLECFMFK